MADYGIVQVGDFPASSVAIQAADVNSALIGASGGRPLATARGLVALAGVLVLRAEVDAMDDDQGGPLSPDALPHTLELR
jgi:hypothetical protein